MPPVGLEPTRPCGQQILSLPRLPFRHGGTERFNARRHYNDDQRPVNEIPWARRQILSLLRLPVGGPLAAIGPIEVALCATGSPHYSGSMMNTSSSPTAHPWAAPRLPSILLVLAAMTALGTAFASQYWGGLNPCEMCWWQRYAYMTAILPLLPSAVLRLTTVQRRVSLLLGGLVFLVGAGLSLFHAGVEQKWWEGFTACTAPISVGGLDDLRAAILAAPVVRCDDIPWSLFGISIAGFSAIASLILALFAVKAAFSTESVR